MTKREITSYKGGRTSRITARVLPKIRQQIEDITDKTGESHADVLQRLIAVEWECLFSSQADKPETK